MIKDHIGMIVALRTTVGHLGEREQHNWWATSFYSEYSESFLGPAFPRSIRLTRLVNTTVAASIVHDHAIGVGKVYHLFRLPEAWEYAIDRYVRDNGMGSQTADALPKSVKTLAELAKGASIPSASERGPVRVGQEDQLVQEAVWRQVAAYYEAAFAGEYRLYPFISTTA